MDLIIHGRIYFQGWSFAFSFGEQFAEKSGELQFGFGLAFGSRTSTRMASQDTAKYITVRMTLALEEFKYALESW